MSHALARTVAQLLFGSVLTLIAVGAYVAVRDWRDQ